MHGSISCTSLSSHAPCWVQRVYRRNPIMGKWTGLWGRRRLTLCMPPCSFFLTLLIQPTSSLHFNSSRAAFETYLALVLTFWSRVIIFYILYSALSVKGVTIATTSPSDLSIPPRPVWHQGAICQVHVRRRKTRSQPAAWPSNWRQHVLVADDASDGATTWRMDETLVPAIASTSSENNDRRKPEKRLIHWKHWFPSNTHQQFGTDSSPWSGFVRKDYRNPGVSRKLHQGSQINKVVLFSRPFSHQVDIFGSTHTWIHSPRFYS